MDHLQNTANSNSLNRGVNHSLEIYGNLYGKSEISYTLGRKPYEKWEISYA